MPGYHLIERKHLSPPLPPDKGIKANSRRLGFVDFLRELDQEDFPFDAESSLLVVGLEDVLLYGRPDMENVAHDIHRRMQRAAGNFERYNCGWVQIMFRLPLKRGETLRAIHPAIELPIYRIFGSPAPDTDNKGNVFYSCRFNLSSAS
jgi:hypothetical protein